jgi:hypothetical protein
MGSLELVATDRLDVQSNWKLALDTFCEVYHVPVVHEQSLSLSQMPNVAIFDDYGRHQRYSGAGRDFEALVGRPEQEWPAMSYQAVHYLFPNTTLSFTHSVDGRTPIVTLSRVFPGESIGDAVTLIATYKRPGEGSLPDEQVAAMHEAVLGIVGSEDYRVAEGVWQSLVSAPAGQKLVLGRNEVLLQRYHQDVAAAVGMPLP